MDKTFRIIPTNNNPAGQFEVTLYWSIPEVQGWEAATGQLASSIELIKLPSQISNVTPANPEPDGPGTVQVVTPTRAFPGSWMALTHTFTNGFSGFGAGIPGTFTALPVTLLKFTGKLQKDNVLLEWTTTMERNNKGFEIEKSFDGVTFRRIGFVRSAGNSTSNRNYNYLDREYASAVNYYRLKIIDLDGTHDYSNIITVRHSQPAQAVYVVENPFRDQINIRFNKIPQGKVGVELYDVKGSRVFKADYSQPGQMIMPVNIGNQRISGGTYILRVLVDDNVYNIKVVKQ
jgi:trimeric autotransporter adhesin